MLVVKAHCLNSFSFLHSLRRGNNNKYLCRLTAILLVVLKNLFCKVFWIRKISFKTQKKFFLRFWLPLQKKMKKCSTNNSHYCFRKWDEIKFTVRLPHFVMIEISNHLHRLRWFFNIFKADFFKRLNCVWFVTLWLMYGYVEVVVKWHLKIHKILNWKSYSLWAHLWEMRNISNSEIINYFLHSLVHVLQLFTRINFFTIIIWPLKMSNELINFNLFYS